MLQALDTTVQLGGKTIVDGVSLSLHPGELLAVLGPNGAGKSTLLRVLTGALAPMHGAASLDGRNLRDWNSRTLARRRAVLPQSSPLSFGFRAYEIVQLGREPHAGLTAQSDDDRIVEAAMVETDVVHLAERVYPTLSGGEQQRVQLARVLSQVWPADAGPDEEGLDEEGPGEEGADEVGADRFLLLDEPTSSLDLAHQHAMLKLARRWAHWQANGGDGPGVGVLVVLHDLNLAALYADRVCLLKGGRLTADGTPDSVLTAETIEACFDLPVTVTRHPIRDCPYVIPA